MGQRKALKRWKKFEGKVHDQRLILLSRGWRKGLGGENAKKKIGGEETGAIAGRTKRGGLK